MKTESQKLISQLILPVILFITCIICFQCEIPTVKPLRQPTVETIRISGIGTSSFNATGKLISENGSPISEMGFFWSDLPPVISSWGQLVTWHKPFKTLVRDQTPGQFYALIEGLNPNQQYFCQAFAINDVGTGYGDVKDFFTAANPAPAASTNPVLVMIHSQDGASAVLSADIDTRGTTSKIERKGFCYSTNPNPTITDKTVFAYQEPAPLTTRIHMISNLPNLEPNTTYFARSFVTNQAGSTAYGNVSTFSIPSAPPTLKDVDDNTYQTVQIGKQVWMAENLRSMHYRNGAQLNNREGVLASYGGHYTWLGINDMRGICPQGWHVPNDTEWIALEVYMGIKPSEVNILDLSVWRGYENFTGAMLKAVNPLWKQDSPWTNNYSQFGALPLGNIKLSNPYFPDQNFLGLQAEFCTSTLSDDQQIVRILTNVSTGIQRGLDSKTNGYSCRCIQD